MPHFKDSENKLYWLDEQDDPKVWLPNCIEISDSEAEAIRIAEEERLLTYADRRSAEYPSFADQFDLLYHGGYDAWRSKIQEIKDKYPKT